MRFKIKKNPKFALVGHWYHLNFFFDELTKSLSDITNVFSFK